MANYTYDLATGEGASGGKVTVTNDASGISLGAMKVVIDDEAIIDRDVFLSYLERMRAHVLGDWPPVVTNP